jgi:gamma-glutamylcyclotransferase (GGCT)/AIG2-like uncharacterized protein YtfP
MSNNTSIVKVDDDLPKSDTVCVGVYGTLKSGFGNHKVLGEKADVKYEGVMTVPGIMLHLEGFPMVIQIPDHIDWRRDSRITLEVYRISTPRLKRLDMLEGHPRFFERKPFHDYQHGDVWVYFGHWEEYLKGPQRMITTNTWGGPQTKFVNVDFMDGSFKHKPKMDLKSYHIFTEDINKFTNNAYVDGCIIDVSTGEIEKLLIDHPTSYTEKSNPPHYRRKIWDSSITGYKNEFGQVLEYDLSCNDFVLKGSAKQKVDIPPIHTSPARKQPEGPSVVQVPKQTRLTNPFPDIVTL